MFRLLSFTLISIVLIYTIKNTAAAADRFVTGKITHDGVNHIEKNSKIEVKLQDVSLMDVAAKLISTITITDATKFPISFKIAYDPSVVKAGHTYSVSVRITSPDHKLQFINDVRAQANLEKSSPMVDVPVIRVGEIPSVASTQLNDKKVCKPVKCSGKTKVCPYGFQKLDGCEICKCNDPCNPPGKPILCGPHQRCFIEKKTDGTFGTRCDTTSKKGKDKKITDPNIICKQPKVTGPCKAYLKRFRYNALVKTCEPFVYGGCKGNQNNFATKIECENTCKSH
ncbi:hypothetical protein I4U23_028931 [Adineta vaga]|nr:hypothetical protein I4U23_028931 [Adineta vaga]